MVSPGVVIALTAAGANLSMAALHFAIARAPGWRIARLYAGIAFTAGLYSILNAIYCVEGLSDATYLAAGRLSYLVGTVQCVFWFVYAYSDSNGSLRTAPRSVRWVAISTVAAALVFAATGWLLTPRISPVRVAAAGVVYYYPLETAAGDVYLFLVLVLPAAALLRLTQRFRRGERFLGWQLGLFGVVLLCGIEEVLVANRILNFLSLLDAGFLLLVMPLSWQVVARVINDARKLRGLSDHLEIEVLQRTEERDQVRQALITAENNIADLVASLDAIVWEADASTLEATFVSEGAKRLLGYSDDQWGHFLSFWSRHVHPDDRERVLAAMRGAVQSKSNLSLEYRVLAADGRILWFQNYLHPVVSPTVSQSRLRGVILDATEGRRARDALLESEKRFHQMADTAPVGIWMTGPDGMISFYNQHALRFVNRTPEQLIGTAGMDCIHPDDRGDVQSAFSSALADHSRFEVTCRLQRSDGEYRWVLCGGVPRFEINNEFCGYIGSFIDVTDLRRAHDQSLARQKMESLGVLASGIAHDFNNLLGGILASTEVALAERAAPAVEEELLRIKTACIVAAKIVRQLMIYGGAEGSDRQSVDISSLIHEMLPLLKVVVSKHAIVEVEFDENLPLVQANSAQVEQVVMNLITNASEAIGDRDGVIRVNTSGVRVNAVSQMPSGTTLPDGEYVQLAVHDTGSGMTPEVQARVFDPFFTTKFNGRGLGLAVVQGIVRSHGGAIHVQSTIGKGSVFQVVLPCAPSAVQSLHRSATREQEDRRAPVTAAREQVAHRTGTILLVEDEPVLRGAVAKFLRKSGFSVLEALDGFEAMELLRSHADNLDAVLLDVTLPGVPSRDVFEYAQRLRPQLKIILTSAYDRETVWASFAGLNATHFIRKPFQLSDLVSVL
jgi:PAS domain S-box-containing protein